MAAMGMAAPPRHIVLPTKKVAKAPARGRPTTRTAARSSGFPATADQSKGVMRSEAPCPACASARGRDERRSVMGSNVTTSTWCSS